MIKLELFHKVHIFGMTSYLKDLYFLYNIRMYSLSASKVEMEK